MKSLSVKIVLVLALMIGFTCGSVYAQVDFTIWDGSLWKMKQTAKGYYFDDEKALEISSKANGTEQVWGVMAANDIGDALSIAIYEKLENGACSLVDTFTLVKQAGGPLGFFATFEKDVADTIYAHGLFYFTGKLKDAALQKGKMTTLGAFAVEQDFEVPGDLVVSGVNMSGTTVQELKCVMP